MRYKRKKENKMPALVLDSKYAELQSKLDFITKKADTLKTNKGRIELDPDNERHQEWFEVDKYKGK